MAGKRMLHKNICTSEKINSINFGAENLYYRLLTVVDDAGRYFANPHHLKDVCFPVKQISTGKIGDFLADLEKVGLIHRYVVDNVSYLEIKKFDDFQYLRPDRPKRVDFPVGKPLVNQPKTIDKAKVEVKDKVEVKVMCDELGDPFGLLWERYPSKVGRKQAEKHFNNSVQTKEDFSAVQKALDNYLKSNRVAKGYIQNGSTWFNNWRDWVDYKEPHKKNIVDQAKETLKKMEKAGV